MPQAPIELTVAEVEKLFHVRVIDVPVPKLSAAEVKAQSAKSWWARRLRFGWRRTFAMLALPAPKDRPS